VTGPSSASTPASTDTAARAASSADAAAATPWHAREVGEATAAFGVDPARGLSDGEVDRRRHEVGRNALPVSARRHPAMRLLDQFREPLILLLLVAAVVAFAIGDTVDAVAIAVVVSLNSVLGWIQELNAERQVDALRTLIRTEVRVRRAGTVDRVPADELVPGDVVLLDAGDRVPADGRVLVAERAETEEAALTGESVPVGKSTAAVAGEDVPLGDRRSVAFSGTHVSRGRLELLITATGPRTQLGRLAALVEESSGTRTPLQRQLQDLGKRLSLVAAVAVVILATLGIVRGTPLGEVAIEAVAVAAAALPEGLPTAVTITLALAVQAMARRRAVVRGLPAVETLGATSVICTDKTGTLTEQRLQVVEAYVEGRRVDLAGDELRPALHAFVLASDATAGVDGDVGDPTEVALLAAARDGGVDVEAVRRAARRVAEDPFDPSTRRMTVVVEHDDGRRELLVKGASEALVDAGVTADIGPVDALAERALRTLAVARRDLAVDEPLDDVEALLHDLEPLGLVALMDPLRGTAADTIAAARRAGMDVVMMTGDHRATAASIAADAGIDGRVVEGRDVRAMSDVELDAVVQDLGVVARVAPDDKLRIVQAFQRHGRVVAVTGDGANDAAALRAAEVGVALGSGTDVAREAADVVLLDDDLGTLMVAVEHGRAMHDNLRTFLRFQLTTNAALVLTLVAASLLGLAAPMSAAQVLWVNLVADGPPAVALGVDPPAAGVLDRRPRDPHASLLDRGLAWRVLPGAVVMAAAALAAQVLVTAMLTGEGVAAAEADAIATTVAFSGFVFAQVANAFVVRGSGRSVFHTPARNPFLTVSLVLVVLLQVVLVQVPALNTIARTTPLDGRQWLIAAAVAIVWPLVREVGRLVIPRSPG
jgi:P-type Ca2+ transporter type 2C